MPSTEQEVFFYIPYYDIEAYILELCYFYMTYPKKAIFVNGKFIHKLIRFNALEILLLPKIEINENRRLRNVYMICVEKSKNNSA